MNMKIAVLGAAKSGKTLFCINFAEYLGARSLWYTESSPHGTSRGVVSPHEARKLLVDPGSRLNGAVRSFAVHLPGMRRSRIVLVDTASLKEKDPLPPVDGKYLSLTLQALRQADTALYMVDLSCGDPSRLDFASQAGRHLAEYCLQNGINYLTVGAKRDLNGSTRLSQYFFTLSERMPRVSALTGDGFPHLRNLLTNERRFCESGVTRTG